MAGWVLVEPDGTLADHDDDKAQQEGGNQATHSDLVNISYRSGGLIYSKQVPLFAKHIYTCRTTV